jgi:hypothetical protein
VIIHVNSDQARPAEGDRVIQPVSGRRPVLDGGFVVIVFEAGQFGGCISAGSSLPGAKRVFASLQTGATSMACAALPVREWELDLKPPRWD